MGLDPRLWLSIGEVISIIFTYCDLRARKVHIPISRIGRKAYSLPALCGSVMCCGLN